MKLGNLATLLTGLSCVCLGFSLLMMGQAIKNIEKENKIQNGVDMILGKQIDDLRERIMPKPNEWRTNPEEFERKWKLSHPGQTPPGPVEYSDPSPGT